MIILKLLEKIWLVFFSSEVFYKKKNTNKIRTSLTAFKKKAQRDVLGYMITKKITSLLKKNMSNNILRFVNKTKVFERCCFLS